MDKNYLAIDTEFERRTTYYAKFALLQIYDDDAIYLIDPLAIECPNNLKAIFEDPGIVKILHSSKEDLEVLYTAWNCKLEALFDTQVAYSFLYSEPSIGYAKLVDKITGVVLSKEETHSDWTQRPISEQQIQYAAKDVFYLPPVFRSLEKTMNNQRVKKLFRLECQEYCQNAILKVDTPLDFRQAKEVWQLNGIELGLFKLLFEWREETARKNNRTRNHIICEQSMIEMSKIKPSSVKQLKLIEGIHPRSFRLYSVQWIEIITAWQLSGKKTLAIEVNPREIKNLKSFCSELEVLVKTTAQSNKISPTLLFSKRLIRKLAIAILTNCPPPTQWSGWRKNCLEKSINNMGKKPTDL